MPNLYKSAGMQKYLDNEKDPIENKTGIKINTRTLICGLSGSGKTNALTQFILLCNGVFDKLYLCYKTDEPFYEMLIDQLKEDDLIEVHRSLSSFPEVNDFEDAAAYKRRKEKAPK
jgi:ABC-type lipoprotein export system ATPase subunit